MVLVLRDIKAPAIRDAPRSSSTRVMLTLVRTDPARRRPMEDRAAATPAAATPAGRASIAMRISMSALPTTEAAIL